MTDSAQRHHRMLGECVRAFVTLVGGYEALTELGSIEELWSKYPEVFDEVVRDVKPEDLKGMSDLAPGGSMSGLMKYAPVSMDPVLLSRFFAKVAIAQMVFREASGPSHKKTAQGMAAPGWDKLPHSIKPSNPPPGDTSRAAATPLPMREPIRVDDTVEPITPSDRPLTGGPVTQLAEAATPGERKQARSTALRWLAGLVIGVPVVVALVIGGGHLLAWLIERLRH